MKRIFTHLFVTVLLMLSVTSWAQSGTKTYTVSPSGGSYNRVGWCANWTSNSSEYPVTKIDVAGGVNNMNASTTSGGFEFAVGTNNSYGYGWNFSVPGYKIESYSFKFKSKTNNQNISVVAGGQTMTSSYSTQQTLTVNNVNAQVASFQLTGSNYAIIVTELTFTVTPILEVGQVYMFKNARADRSLSADGTDDVHTKATDVNDTKQQWYVTKEGDYYVLRNLATAKYLKGNGQSGAWSMTNDYSHDYNKFELCVSNTTLNTLHTKTLGDYAYMHDDNNGDNGGYNVVGWQNGNANTGSHWTITKVDYTAEEIKSLLDAVPTTAEVAAYQPSLDALFADGACVTPKLASLSEAQSSEAYKALPAGLQRMVDKVYGGNWEEATVAPADRPNGNNNTNHNLWTVENSWNSDYAKKFRVQMYEPYSIESEVTSYLRINAHCNMDNPTGIYANSGDVIYIMVGDDIPDGAELWLTYQSGNGATQYYNNSAYTQLHKGLNRVTFTTDGCQMWINYVVHTYNADGATIAEKFPENRKLSNYKPLKIHIEGGHINGFFNTMGDFRAVDSDTENLWGDVDNDDDWNYYKARVALPTDFALLGHRQTLLFPFGTYNSGKGHFGTPNADGGIEYALAYHLEHINVASIPNCYGGSGIGFGNYSDTYYPGMGLSATNGKINIMMEAWDRITYSELASMGLVSTSTMDKMNALYPRWTSNGTPAEIYNYGSATVNNVTQSYKEFCQGVDYSEYFNHHACGVGAGSGYMSGGWRVCNYHYNTMGSIIGAIANEAGPTWGPAHEIGHQHQAVYNLNGQTEVTNNFFSNIAVWYMGMGTSRVNGNEGSLESVLAAFNTKGNDLYTNNIWAITHLYYRLWLYYHLAGNNTQFWPRLFELCRQEPLENGGQISGETTLLRFYQHACNAAGEDLTEFFRAHGFFEIMDNRLVGDYSNATYNVTQEQIDAAIAAVKAKSYPVNYAVLLINDGTSETTKKHDGSTSRSLWDGSATAEFGSVNDFIDGDVEVLTNYAATVNADGSVTMSGGQGGVGFLVFDENGELISFSNKSTFKLGDEALEAIVSGKATITTVDSESNVTTAEVDVTAMQRTVLEQLIAKAQPIVDKIDNTYTRIGYFKGAAVADLASALEYAKEVYEGSSGFEAAYDLLYAEYTKVLQNADSKILFNPSLTYNITNYGYTSETMWVNSSNVVRSENNVDKTSNDARWKFVETSTAGVYNIRTLNNDYIPAVQQSASMTATAGQADANALYTLEEVKDGVWAIKLSPAADYRNLHSSWNNVVGWETGADASRWYITAVEADPVIADLTSLEVYINKTELLLDEVLGTVTYTEGSPLQLQTTTQGSAYYLWSNAPEDSEGNIANLVDGATDNYFHTEWSSEPVSGTHYLGVYLGEDNTLERFTFSHTTRSGAGSDFPKSVDVYGSNDGITYKLIGSVSGMPQSAGTAWEYDGIMLSSYKYLRFNYHANRGYWHMAEFDITPVTDFTATVNDTYNSTVTVEAVTAAMNALFNGKRTAAGFSPTTDDVAAKLSALQTAYNALYAQYKATVDARKATLAQLATETEDIINTVGRVSFALDTPLELTTENLYCNAPYTAQNNNDYSAAYVDKLTDGNKTTYLHTNYTNYSSTLPHYLRVDLGDGSTVTKFRFNYSTRDNGNNCPTTIVIEGCDSADGTYTAITTLTTADGLPNPGQNTNGGVAADFESDVIEMSKAYRYVRFKVTSTEGSSSSTFFVMSEFGLNIVEIEEIVVSDLYKECVSNELLFTTTLVTKSSKAMSDNELVTSVPMLDAQILDQQAAKAALEEAMTKLPSLDKDALQSLYDLAAALYGEMADSDGNVNSNYTPSALTNEKLAEVKAILDAARDRLDNSNSQTEINDAKTALQAQYDALLAIKDANLDEDGRGSLDGKIAEVETFLATIATENNGEYTLNPYYANAVGLGFNELCNALQQAHDLYSRFYLTQTQCDEAIASLSACLSAAQSAVNADCVERGTLTTAIGNANTLLNAIDAKGEGYYSSVDNLGADELRSALQNAESVVSSSYLTTEQYNTLLSRLNQCYATTNGVVALDCNSENRNNLSTLIDNVNDLLSTIADAAETTLALPLQTTDDDEAFYIWCNAPAGDSNGVAGLIDKNSDGTANAGTFLGTDWGVDVPAYTHYIEIDLGTVVTIDQLTMDYTTRNSTHADQRPNAIKILGSNDKANYTEITEITEGLASGSGEKWTMASPLALGAHYRYIRIAVGSQRGFFHMSDFNLYTKLSHTLKEYYTTAEGLDLTTLCLALDEAQDAAACYMTTEQYTAVYNKLNTCYTTADGIVDNDYTGRDELAALKTGATTLVRDVVTVTTEGETVIALQATDEHAPYYIYCNAPGATNNYSGDNLGVAALLDVDDNGEPVTATFLHTTYTGNSHDDALDHYLRVDMGENVAVETFRFRYTPRIGNTGNAPLEMFIEGSNDCVDFEEITTLTDMATTYQSVEITNGKAYRYIRFMVKDTHNHSVYNGHKFFAMSHFEMTACKTIAVSDGYASPNLPLSVAANAYNELVDAAVFDVNHYLASETGAEIKDELKAAYNALNAAIALQNIPVKLTTDVNNPVLYKIKINRTATTVLQFDNASKQVAVAQKAEAGNEYQAWYFMQGTDVESNDDILILPYWNDDVANTTLRLGAASTGNAAAAVWAVESGDASKTLQNWYITVDAGNTAEGWWNIRPEGKNNYFSNNGGVGNKMGFWNSSSDNGSEFQFVLDETDYSMSDAYFALYDQYVACGGEVAYGTRIGTYTEASVTTYNTAYGRAAALLDAKNSTDAEYYEARTALATAFDAIEYNGGLCIIRSAYTGGDGYSANKLIYVNADNKLCFETAADEKLSKYVWEFVPVKGGYNLKSLHTQSNVVSATTWGGQVALDDSAAAKLLTVETLETLDEENVIVRLNVSGAHPLHAQKQGSLVVHYPGGLESASAWYLQEIADGAKENIKHIVTMSATFSSVMLGYNAKVPAGVEAYNAVGIEDGYVSLVEVAREGDVIPANTPVILYRTDDETDKTFTYYIADEAIDTPATTVLGGSLYQKFVKCESDKDYYKLMIKSGEAKMYWMYKEFNAEGVSQGNTNDGGHIKCSANKIYMALPSQQYAASFGMRFVSSGTTSFEGLVTEQDVEVIYDLQGRKLVEITQPGFYIVNGKKVYVK